jgi:hypothetical protein
VHTLVADGGLAYDLASGIRFGASDTEFGETYNGLVDEIRYSDSVLDPDQFLRAVPEPGSFSLLLFGAIGLWWMGRKPRSIG